MTPEQANAYFASIPPAEQQAVLASGASVLDWANASEAAGDPRALAHSGVQLPGAGTSDTYGGRVAAGGAPSSEWVGKRNPTPAELRAYSREQGWSEDFARFSDAQLAAWISGYWDIGASKFRSEHEQFAGQFFEKPTDLPEGFALHGNQVITKEQEAGLFGAPAAAPAAAPANENPLANALWGMFQGRQGFFADDPNTTSDDTLTGKLLSGGGLWWGGEGFSLPDTNASFAAPAAPAPAPQPQPNLWGEIPAGGLPTPTPPPGVTPPASTTSPLVAALSDVYRLPNQRKWWMEA